MNTQTLPAHYTVHCTVNLQKDAKTAFALNIASACIAGSMFAIPLVQHIPFSITPLGTFSGIVMLPLLGIYCVLHELVHGVFIKHFSGKKAHYGFTGLYAYAGSSAYFDKKSYIIIALAPVVIWGIVLAFAVSVLPRSWFWTVYVIQCLNMAGAAGDLYITAKILRMPEKTLVQDSGIEMAFYTYHGEYTKQDFEAKAAAILPQCAEVVLSSVSENGYPRPCIVSLLASSGYTELYISTGKDSVKTKQFRANPKAGVCAAKGADSITLTGTVSFVEDIETKKRCWKPWLIEHFPSGAESDEFCVLKFTADNATFWIDGEFLSNTPVTGGTHA